jgi:soluble lytic murein transglycosylase
MMLKNSYISILIHGAGLWLLGISLCVATPETDTRLRNQRDLFQEADKALTQGQLDHYRRLEHQLRDYPLHPYLAYAELNRRLANASPEEVETFIRRYTDSPLASRLQSHWLRTLARQGRWPLLVNNYTPTKDPDLRCSYATALYKVGAPERAFAIMEDLWLTGRSLPQSCDYAIAVWKKAGYLTNDLLWQRIRLAMENGHMKLAHYLAKDLPENERYWFNIWDMVRRDPAYLMKVNDHFAEQRSEVLGWITVDGLRRLARKDPVQAASYWQTLRQRHLFTLDEQERIERRLALALLKAPSPEASQWLRTLNINLLDDRVVSLHFFSAMRDQDWESALEWLERLSLKQQHSPQWRYWRGRLLEARGQLEEARSVYLLNGEERSYYSFLAADRAGHRYQFAHDPITYRASELTDIESLPAIQRARELYAIKRTFDARLEWNYAIKHLPQPQLLKAAKLADSWGWHDRAISTLAQARYWDDLELRFPLAYQEEVLQEAKRNQIDPAWAFAIIRQESAFAADARSRAGALGLMQLLPRTARDMARSLRVRTPGRHDLLQIDTNIQLGVGYLKKVQDRYQGHPVLATAAYNAGPNNVKRWLPIDGTVAADIWIEMVPFSETRDYLKRVLTYTVIYEQRLGQQPKSLLERMTPINTMTTTANQHNKIGKDT